MGHLLKLRWIKVHYDHIFFKKGQNYKSPSKLMAYRSVDNSQTHYTTLFGNNLGKETIHNNILDFIVYFDRNCITSWKCPIPP